jgi:hypothetical protein
MTGQQPIDLGTQMMKKWSITTEEYVMSSVKNLVMITALAILLGFGTACFSHLAGSSKPAKEAEIPECAGLSGQARIDCETRHKKQ